MWQFERRVTTKVTTVLDASDRSDDVNPNVRVIAIAQLVIDPKNANKGTKRGRQRALAPLHRRFDSIRSWRLKHNLSRFVPEIHAAERRVSEPKGMLIFQAKCRLAIRAAILGPKPNLSKGGKEENWLLI
jgi:hypothetical protein